VYMIIIKVLFIKILNEQVKEQKEFYWSLERLEEMHLKICVWRNASEETSLKKALLKTRHQKQAHQKQGYQKHLTISYFTRVDKVQCTNCTSTNSAHISATCLHIKTRKTVTLLQTLFRFKWNGFEINSS